MTRKSTATKTTAAKSSTKTTTRKSTAARTKLPAAAVVETVAAVETVAVFETVAAVETPAVVEAPAARVVSRDELETLVRREAYQRAERRAFRNGSAFEDWVRAEAVVRDQLIADGALLA